MNLGFRTGIIGVLILISISLTACHHGSNDAATSTTPAPAPAPGPTAPAVTTHTLGGGISGLHADQTLVIQNNNGDTLTLKGANGFVFPTPLAEGTSYAVTIVQQPVGETCSIADGSGIMGTSDITSVSIGCIVNLRTIGGSISGLANDPTQNITLQNNGGDDLSLNGSFGYTTFQFYTRVQEGTPYDVTIKTQPSNQICTVSNGSGIAGSTNITNVAVNCQTHGQVSTYAGSTAAGYGDGTGTQAIFSSPFGVTADAQGNLFVADTVNDVIRQIAPGAVVTTLAGNPGVPAYQDGTGSTALFRQPYGVVTDAQGNVYVADTANQRIRKITPDGVVTTFAGSAQGYLDGQGTAAEFGTPFGIAIDAQGNLYVADSGNELIRKITPSGDVTTLAGTQGTYGEVDGTGSAALFFNPIGIAVDGQGNVFVADFGGSTIRKITPTGVVTTIAGTAGVAGNADGTGTAAQFNQPAGLAIDAAGNLYVADSGNNTIRKITPDGVVTTLAGSGTAGRLNGVGTAAQFNRPTGIAFNPVTGTLFVADWGNSQIRQVVP